MDANDIRSRYIVGASVSDLYDIAASIHGFAGTLAGQPTVDDVAAVCRELAYSVCTLGFIVEELRTTTDGREQPLPPGTDVDHDADCGDWVEWGTAGTDPS